jgi:hypothetical protein
MSELAQDFVIGISGFIRHWCLVITHSPAIRPVPNSVSTQTPLFSQFSRLFPLALNVLSIEPIFPFATLAAGFRDQS